MHSVRVPVCVLHVEVCAGVHVVPAYVFVFVCLQVDVDVLLFLCCDSFCCHVQLCPSMDLIHSIRLLQTMGKKEAKEPSDSTRICGTS